MTKGKVVRFGALACGAALSIAAANRNEPERVSVGVFQVEIDGLGTAFFKSVSGLKTETEVLEFQEGGSNEGAHKIPGRTKYANIVLKRGLTGGKELWSWRQTVIDGKPDRRKGTITLLTERGTPVASWQFANGFPVKWEGPELDASKNEVAIETIEIAHEGLIMQ